MADEEEVRQEFVAEAEDYIRPLDEMAEAAGHFRDEAAGAGGAARDLGSQVGELGGKADEASGQLTGLSGGLGDAAGSMGEFREAQASARDAIAQTDHELHEQTESFFAQAQAAETAGAGLDDFGASATAAGLQAGGLQASLIELRSEMGFMGLGESVTATKTGMNQFRIALGETAAAEETAANRGKSLRDSLAETGAAARAARDEIREMGLDASEQAFAASRSLASERDKLIELGVSAGFAKDKLAELAGTQALGGGGNFLESIFGEGAGKPDWLGGWTGIIGGLVAAFGGILPAVASAGIGLGAFAAAAAGNLKEIEAHAGGVVAEFKQFSASMRPEVLNAFSHATALAGTVLEHLGQVARPAGNAISGWLQDLDRSASGPAFTGFMQSMIKMMPEALAGLGKFSGTLGDALMGTLESLEPAFRNDEAGLIDMARALGSAGEGIGDLVTAISPLLPELGRLADNGGQAAAGIAKLAEDGATVAGNLVHAGHAAGQSSDGFRSLAGMIGHAAAQLGDSLYPGLTGTISGLERYGRGSLAAGKDTDAMGQAVNAAASEIRGMTTDTEGLTAAFAKALDPQESLDSAALTYHQDLTTLIGDLKLSHDQIGFQTAAQQASYAAYLQTVEGAQKYAESLGHGTSAAEHMRAALKEAIGSLEATDAHGRAATRMLDDLRAALNDIPTLKEIQIRIDEIGSAAGSGYGGRGPQLRVAGASAAAAMLPAGGTTIHNHNTVNVTVHGSVTAQQDLERRIRQGFNDHTYLNASAGLTLPGRGRGL